MKTSASDQEIMPAILEAISSAQNIYKKWTLDECWLGYAPEYLLACEVANKIFKTANYYVYLEHSVSEALDAACVKKPGPKPSSLRYNGKHDIVVYSKKKNPLAVVEVKSRVGCYKQISSDIERIISVMNLNKYGKGLISSGFLACYLWSDPPKRGENDVKLRLASLVERLKSNIKEKLPEGHNLFTESKIFSTTSEGGSAGVVFLIK